jgi:TM2 domain-containing membrane protein YozV
VYHQSTTYLLWLLSGFGVLGFHRFYLGRIGTGLIWLFTGGLFGLGALFDLFYIPTMVRDENLKLGYREALGPDHFRPRNVTPSEGTSRASAGSSFASKESLERVILRTAKSNRGLATPAEIALAADIRIDDAKRALEKLVEQGYAEMQVRKNGQLVYVFPEFLSGNEQFEAI